MKNLFLIYILACMTSLFIFTSCEENTDQVIKAQPDTTNEITTRTIEDCDDCPINYCCCSAQLLDGPATNLIFCGVYTNSGGTPCGGSPSSPCGTFSGSSALVYVSSTQKGLFCVPPGTTFSVTNPNNVDITIRFTCQYDQVNPIPQTVTIGMTSTRYFYHDGDCIIQLC